MMELRPRKNEILRCGYCHDNVVAIEARYLREAGSGAPWATLALHDECSDEVNSAELRYVEAPLAYGIAEHSAPLVSSPEILDIHELRAQGAVEAEREVELGLEGPNKVVFARGGGISGAVLTTTQIAARGMLRMRNESGQFVNVYEPLAIKAEDCQLRLCLHDTLGLKVIRGLVFSGGKQLCEGSYHSNTRLSTGLVSIDTGGVISVVYDQGDFVDVQGGITLSRPPSTLPRHLHPKMSRRNGDKKQKNGH